MANILQNLGFEVSNIEVPPVPVLIRFPFPVFHLKLAQLRRQIHQCNCNHLWFPLKTKGGTKTVIHKCPRHLNHLLKLRLVSLQALGILQKGRVGMVNLEIKLDGLKQNSFQGHHLLSWVLLKATELSIVGQSSHCPYQVFALLRSFFRLTSQKQNTSGSHIARKLLETMLHVEPVKINRCRGHCVMPQSQGLAYLLDKPCPLSPVSGLCVKVKASEVGGSLLQVTLLIIPVRHLASNLGAGQEDSWQVGERELGRSRGPARPRMFGPLMPEQFTDLS